MAKLHPMEADVTLTDGSVVRVMGLLAVKFRTDPDGVRKFIEDLKAEKANKAPAIPKLKRSENGF